MCIYKILLMSLVAAGVGGLFIPCMYLGRTLKVVRAGYIPDIFVGYGVVRYRPVCGVCPSKTPGYVGYVGYCLPQIPEFVGYVGYGPY